MEVTVFLLFLGFIEPQAVSKPSPLLDAAAVGDVATVSRLLRAGNSPNVAGEDGETPLTVAARRGATQVVETLLRAGAKTDARRWNGETPLHAAVASSVPETVSAVLRAKPDVNAVENRRKQSPLHYAAAEGQLAIVELLLAAGAKPDLASEGGATPLWLAAQGGHDKTVIALIKAGAQADVVGPEGYQPIHLAARTCRPEMVSALGAVPLDPKNKMGSTPLHVAVGQACLPVTKALVEAGADLNATDARGSKPIDLARRRRMTEMLAYLESRTPKP